jgi:hypothetical protein
VAPEFRLWHACLLLLLGTILLAHESGAGGTVPTRIPEKAAADEASSGCLRRTPEASVVELLELMGMFEEARTQTKSMVDQLRRKNPKVPEAYWSSFASHVADRDTLISLYTPV